MWKMENRLFKEKIELNYKMSDEKVPFSKRLLQDFRVFFFDTSSGTVAPF